MCPIPEVIVVPGAMEDRSKTNHHFDIFRSIHIQLCLTVKVQVWRTALRGAGEFFCRM
jgi:hypothetical protein